jgi:hypothetical protein
MLIKSADIVFLRLYDVAEEIRLGMRRSQNGSSSLPRWKS